MEQPKPRLQNVRREHGKMDCAMHVDIDESDSIQPEPEGIVGGHQTSLPSDKVRIAELELELSQMRDRWMRSQAEIANVRTRGRRDLDETREFAIQKFATDVVEAAENLHRGLDTIPSYSATEPKIVTGLRDGFRGVERSFIGLLERNGIKRQDPTGSAFDASLHQAMEETQTANHPSGTVLQAWSSVWTLNGRLLRPAMVVVARAAQGHPSQHTSGAYS